MAPFSFRQERDTQHPCAIEHSVVDILCRHVARRSYSWSLRYIISFDAQSYIRLNTINLPMTPPQPLWLCSGIAGSSGGLFDLLMVAMFCAEVGELLSRKDVADSLTLIVTLKIADLIEEVSQESMRVSILMNGIDTRLGDGKDVPVSKESAQLAPHCRIPIHVAD